MDKKLILEKLNKLRKLVEAKNKLKSKPITRQELKDMIKNGEDITDVNISKIKDMSYIFAFDIDIVGDISNWDVSKVKNMASMFKDNKLFNQDISDWNTKNV